MAKQTINIGAAPNDGTGTPLRTSFDYCNQNFTELYTATGPSGNNIVVPGTATISGDLTVDTSTLKVDSTNNRVGIGTASPSFNLHVVGSTDGRLQIEGSSGFGMVFVQASSGNTAQIQLNSNGGSGRRYLVGSNSSGQFLISDETAGATRYSIDSTGISTWSVGGSTAMTLNSSGLGVGLVPSVLSGFGTTLRQKSSTGAGGFFTENSAGTSWFGIYSGFSLADSAALIYPSGGTLRIATTTSVGTGGFDPKMTLDSSGNVGIGVTPSAWGSGKAIEVLEKGYGIWNGTGSSYLLANAYFNSGFKYANTGSQATHYYQYQGTHVWSTAASGTAGNAITFTQAMTLDDSGNLLVGTTSGTYHTFRKNLATDVGNAVFEIQGTGGATSSIYYSVSGYNANAANAASKFGRDATTLRSINAGGTINASGADYAEYMVKCGDFVLAKGDVAGIDANGKLTNVFADAVSFVVKSTDPSYVGNDKWGVGLEGADLESARQLVDRIAFAGQVPVNVTGAKAGDYIVPVVNGTGIKGIAVSNPTFEQYKLAVGKVITIDADGRARIIVKVA